MREEMLRTLDQDDSSLIIIPHHMGIRQNNFMNCKNAQSTPGLTLNNLMTNAQTLDPPLENFFEVNRSQAFLGSPLDQDEESDNIIIMKPDMRSSK